MFKRITAAHSKLFYNWYCIFHHYARIFATRAEVCSLSTDCDFTNGAFLLALSQNKANEIFNVETSKSTFFDIPKFD